MKVKEKIQKITFINDVYTKWKWRERTVSYGNENPDKTFFVIRRATCKVGLFSHVMTNMGLVRYAMENNYIPVIDMQSNLNSYLEESQVGKENAWEFYFEQLCGYTLKDISKSRNVILSDGLITEKNEYPTSEIINNMDKCNEWRLFFNKNLQIKDEIIDLVQCEYEKLFEGKKVLGVLCRGTDYINNHPKNHPVQPQMDDVISKSISVADDYKCELIYLATEDESVYQKFKESLKGRLRTTSAKRCTYSGSTNINDISYHRKNDKYLKGREYLINILLVAKCNCLVAGSVGGTYGALLLSEGYEYQFVFDLGFYQ